MAKRPCPFEDNCAPQMKIHVSETVMEKQDEAAMKAVQARTVNKLFDASNKPTVLPSAVPAVQEATGIPVCGECKIRDKGCCSKCYFCELYLCESCIRACTFCSENFCSRCAVAIYRNGNRFICLTCYN